MNTADFQFLSAILKQRSGLVLTEEKAYLLESRLMPVARKFGFAGLPELVEVGGGQGVCFDVHLHFCFENPFSMPLRWTR